MMSAVPAQNAATILLVRSGADDALEVLLIRRPPAMRFLGGFYVFPGGSVKSEDCAESVLKHCSGVSMTGARRLLGGNLSPQLALGHWVAAIRELFEEAGILLCLDETGTSIDARDERIKSRLLERQHGLLEGSLGFEDLLELERWSCDIPHVAYFSHWQTPEEFSMRFDTRFFLALLPEGQTPIFRSREVAGSLWLSPDRALSVYREGNLPLIFPTYASLRTLADFASLSALCNRHRLR